MCACGLWLLACCLWLWPLTEALILALGFGSGSGYGFLWLRFWLQDSRVRVRARAGTHGSPGPRHGAFFPPTPLTPCPRTWGGMKTGLSPEFVPLFYKAPICTNAAQILPHSPAEPGRLTACENTLPSVFIKTRSPKKAARTSGRVLS